jgi:uncharacterized damage-inducible protein DinB
MIPHDYVHTMAAYNQWMNQRLYDACAELSVEQRKRDLRAFFKSIHGTLNHLLLGDRLWMGRFRGVPFQIQSLDQELYSDFATLRAERELTDKDIIEWVHGLRDEDFRRDLSFLTIANPQPHTCPFSVAVLQFFNHQTHHRGQLTTLLMQNGIDPGVTDLMWLPHLQRPDS